MLIKIPDDCPTLLATAESMHPCTDRVGAYYISEDFHNYYVMFKGSNLPFYIGSDDESLWEEE